MHGSFASEISEWMAGKIPIGRPKQICTWMEENMTSRARSAVVCLFLISFGTYQAAACVTQGTDLSSGGFETSAATDPCSGQFGHGPLLSSAGVPYKNSVPVRRVSWIWKEWASNSCQGIVSILLLLSANRCHISGLHQDMRGGGLNVFVTGANR